MTSRKDAETAKKLQPQMVPRSSGFRSPGYGPLLSKDLTGGSRRSKRCPGDHYLPRMFTSTTPTRQRSPPAREKPRGISPSQTQAIEMANTGTR